MPDEPLSTRLDPNLCPNCGQNPPVYCHACWEQPTTSLDRETMKRLLRDADFSTLEGRDRCVDRLMAWARPHPLRKEELDAIWKGHQHQYASDDDLKEAIWRWATGQGATPRWCEHLAWHTEAGWSRWIVRSRIFPDGRVSPAWTLYDGSFCPLCGKPKPTQEGGCQVTS